jgi:hypothetical protein
MLAYGELQTRRSRRREPNLGSGGALALLKRRGAAWADRRMVREDVG